jgi:hypothetical protein
VLPFAAALVVALGLIGLIALQFGPDLETSKPVPPAAAQTASNPPPTEAVPVTEENKPSPMESSPAAKAPSGPPVTATQTSPAETDVQTPKKAAEGDDSTQEQPERPKLKPRPAKGPQDVFITSDPAGATATLDNDPSASCKTPCILSVMPGTHPLAVNESGYQQESREVRIIDSPVELPLVTLRAHGGTLMITSVPVGATVFLNDKPMQKTTPAQLNVVPGTYNVRVEKDGLRKSESVDIRNGETRYLKIPLQ